MAEQAGQAGVTAGVGQHVAVRGAEDLVDHATHGDRNEIGTGRASRIADPESESILAEVVGGRNVGVLPIVLDRDRSMRRTAGLRVGNRIPIGIGRAGQATAGPRVLIHGNRRGGGNRRIVDPGNDQRHGRTARQTAVTDRVGETVGPRKLAHRHVGELPARRDRQAAMGGVRSFRIAERIGIDIGRRRQDAGNRRVLDHADQCGQGDRSIVDRCHRQRHRRECRQTGVAGPIDEAVDAVEMGRGHVAELAVGLQRKRAVPRLRLDHRREHLGIQVAVVGQHVSREHAVFRAGKGIRESDGSAVGQCAGCAQAIASRARADLACRFQEVEPTAGSRPLDARVQGPAGIVAGRDRIAGGIDQAEHRIGERAIAAGGAFQIECISRAAGQTDREPVAVTGGLQRSGDRCSDRQHAGGRRRRREIIGNHRCKRQRRPIDRVVTERATQAVLAEDPAQRQQVIGLESRLRAARMRVRHHRIAGVVLPGRQRIGAVERVPQSQRVADLVQQDLVSGVAGRWRHIDRREFGVVEQHEGVCGVGSHLSARRLRIAPGGQGQARGRRPGHIAVAEMKVSRCTTGHLRKSDPGHRTGVRQQRLRRRDLSRVESVHTGRPRADHAGLERVVQRRARGQDVVPRQGGIVEERIDPDVTRVFDGRDFGVGCHAVFRIDPRTCRAIGPARPIARSRIRCRDMLAGAEGRHQWPARESRSRRQAVRRRRTDRRGRRGAERGALPLRVVGMPSPGRSRCSACLFQSPSRSFPCRPPPSRRTPPGSSSKHR